MKVKNISSSQSVEVRKPSNEYLTVTRVAKFALMFLGIISLATAVTSAVLFFHMGIGAASIALITSSIAFGILTTGIIYPKIEKKLPYPIQIIGAVVASLAKEFFSALMTLGVITYGLLAKNKDPSPNGKNPILLIHGYGMNAGCFSYLKYCLKKNGVGPIYSINLGGACLSIDDYAKQVSAKMDQINLNHSGKVTIIGHSMGGIVAARYLANCQDKDHIEQLITLGSPLQGTYTAYLGPGKNAHEMRPSSPFLKKLENDLATNTIPITTVESQCDLIVFPNKNASFKTVQADKLKIKSMGHSNYLFSDQIASLIVKKITS